MKEPYELFEVYDDSLIVPVVENSVRINEVRFYLKLQGFRVTFRGQTARFIGVRKRTKRVPKYVCKNFTSLYEWIKGNVARLLAEAGLEVKGHQQYKHYQIDYGRKLQKYRKRRKKS